jgi:hypothetical protein
MRTLRLTARLLGSLVAGSACSEPGAACFGAETLIATPRGPRRIADLVEGDDVLCFDHQTRRVTEARVRRVFRHEGALVGRLSGPVLELRVTAEHPIFDVTRAEYRVASEVDTDTELLCLSGAAVDPVRGYAFQSSRERDTVYNLEVEGHHNYFAGGVLVHNKSPECFGPCLSGGGNEAGATGGVSGAGPDGQSGEPNEGGSGGVP